MTVFRAGRVEEASVWGSMTAISQPSPARCTTTPPAEISRTMAPKLTGLQELVTGTEPEPRALPQVTPGANRRAWNYSRELAS